MCFRYLVLVCSAMLLLAAPGCQKSSTNNTGTPPEPPPLTPDTVLRVHWIGKQQLALDGSAFYINRLWDTQESRLLEARTLDNLAAAPWRMLHGDAAVSNAPVMLLRWLLESLKFEESYLEIRSSTNQPMQLALAVRLADQRAAAWQTNLAFVVDSLTGFSPVSNHDGTEGWSVAHSQAPARIELVRGREWTVVGIAREQNTLMQELLKRVHKHTDPFGTSTTNLWLSADIDLQWAAQSLGWMTNNSSHLPRVSLAVTGDGGNVLTHSTLTFPEPLPDNLEPWTIPTKLIHEPLTSFAAARGIHPLVSSLRWWNTLPLGEAPNQLFYWSIQGNPFQIHLATPMPDARVRMDALTAHLLSQVNPWLKNNGPRVNDSGIPLFEKLSGTDGVRWTIPGLWPYVKPVETAGTSFLLAGLTPEQNAGTPLPVRENRFEEILNRTNLVYWSWESTGSRLDDWLPVLQTTRILAHHAPLPDNCLSLTWLKSLQLRLGETKTRVTRTGPDTLELWRKSTLGFSAAELHLIADWLESPQFPRGLHTFVAPPPGPEH